MKAKKTKKGKTRKIDRAVADIYSRTGQGFTYISKKQIRTKQALFVLALTVGIAASTIIIRQNNLENQSRAETINHILDRMKKYGCVADGLLTGSGGDTEGSIRLIERSRCEYLHRAVETWVTPPDFDRIEKNLRKIKKKELIYGMFLAEAVGINSEYYFPDENRNFDFAAMCRPGSQGFWGEGTCKAYFGNEEYRKYLRYIVRKAIDLDIQSFMFGQIYFQDNEKLSRSWAREIVEEMRDYAHSKGKFIIIGAQTNDIRDKKYLKYFDYIEGGVGINDKGEIEDGPCFSRWWKKPGDRCWALLWNKEFSGKANNVLLHLDWSGLDYDDMSRFARMDPQLRASTLGNLYKYFREKDMGFLMPYLAVVYKNNGGCYGPNPEYYSPDNRYSCKDEDLITAIFLGNRIGNYAEFIEQEVPATMVSGQKYPVSIALRNNGTKSWTREENYYLGAQNPQDNSSWGGRVSLEAGEEIKPGETKKFTFQVTAPEVSGTYNFQWQMIKENEEWFGEKTRNIPVSISLPFGFPVVENAAR